MRGARLTVRAVPVRLVMRLDDYVRDLIRELSLVTVSADAGTADTSAAVLGLLRGLAEQHADLLMGDRGVAESAYTRGVERLDLAVDCKADAQAVLRLWTEALSAAQALADLLGPPPDEVVRYQQEWMGEMGAQLQGRTPTQDPFPRSWEALLASGAMHRSVGGGVSTAADAHARAERTVERTVPRDPAQVGLTRQWLAAALVDWGAKDVSDVALLALSEVLTNALLHAPGAIRVGAELSDRALRVDVTDATTAMPRRRRHSDETMSGRGLDLVAMMTSRWGVSPDPDGRGKTVWFEVDRFGGEP